MQKQIIAEAEKNFDEFDKRSVFPILSFSVRTKDEEKSVICLIAGRDLMKNLSLLPDPYSKFVVKGQKNNHITSFYDGRSKLNFVHMFIQIPIFLPINDRKSLFSAICPLHEDFLLDLPQI